MNSSVELLLVMLIVGAASVALGRRFYLFITNTGQGGSACGSRCGGCASKAETIKSSGKPLVQLDSNAKKPH